MKKIIKSISNVVSKIRKFVAHATDEICKDPREELDEIIKEMDMIVENERYTQLK